MSSDLVHPGLSIQSQIDFLYHCRSAMTSIAGRAQPTEVRSGILDTCGTESQVIAAASPGFSAAYYTEALVASFIQDDAQLNEGLARSYETAPYEQWVAELRADLVEDNFSRIEPRLLKRHQADLTLLLGNDRGRRFLAPRYLTFGGLRSRLDLLLTQEDATDARRFLNIVERLRVERSRTNGR